LLIRIEEKGVANVEGAFADAARIDIDPVVVVVTASLAREEWLPRYVALFSAG
jgi:hypothetical protein